MVSWTTHTRQSSQFLIFSSSQSSANVWTKSNDRDKNWKLWISPNCVIKARLHVSTSLALLLVITFDMITSEKSPAQLGSWWCDDVLQLTMLWNFRKEKRFHFHLIFFSPLVFIRRVSSCWCSVRRKAPRMRSKHGSSGIHGNIQ